MKVRVPTARKNGRSREIDDVPSRRPAPPGADTEAVPLTEVRDLRGRPLPVVYMPLLGLLVIVAATYGLVVDDAYRLVPALTRETWRAQDAVTLATVPVLFWATWRARAGSLGAHLVGLVVSVQPLPRQAHPDDVPAGTTAPESSVSGVHEHRFRLSEPIIAKRRRPPRPWRLRSPQRRRVLDVIHREPLAAGHRAKADGVLAADFPRG